MLPSTQGLAPRIKLHGSLLDLPHDDQQAQAVNLVKTALRVFREVPGTPEFNNAVVSSVTEMIDVDRALVLERTSNGWKPSAMAKRDIHRTLDGEPTDNLAESQIAATFSRTLVQRVVECQQTVIVEPERSGISLGASMLEIARAVASPIFDEQREIVAILYADKRIGRAGPAATMAWINDVFSCLSECVLRHDGVVVDYVGDELMAMFGAPEPQIDHADCACQAPVKNAPTHSRIRRQVARFGPGFHRSGVPMQFRRLIRNSSVRARSGC
jgi:hypothetical protein